MIGMSTSDSATALKERSRTPTASISSQHPFEIGLGYHLRITNRLMRQYLQLQIQPYGVALGMWDFLRTLWNEDGLTQRELAVAVGTTEPTALSAIALMERNGIVRRQKNTQDRRRINVHLTDKGRALEAVLLPLAKEVTDCAGTGLAPDEKEALLKMLRLIQANVRGKINNAAGSARPIEG